MENNIVVSEIEKNKVLLDNSNKLIEFYNKMDNIDKKNEEIKNKKLYEMRLKYFSGIEKLPLYLKINNITFNEENLYKDNLININKTKIEELTKELKTLENNVININNEINRLYESYKVNNEDIYIEKAKSLLNETKECKDNIDDIKIEINSLKIENEKIKNIDRNTLIEDLKKQYNVPDLSSELTHFIPNNIDKLVVPMCKDLNILDEIIDEMRRYNKLCNTDTCVKLFLPRSLNSYEFDNSYLCSLYWLSHLSDCTLNDNELRIFDVKDFDSLLEKIEYGLALIDGDRVDISLYKGVLDQFPRYLNECDLFDLKQLGYRVLKGEYSAPIISDINRLIENIEDLDRKLELLFKKIQTKNIKNRINSIKKERLEKIKLVLNKLWMYLIDKYKEILDIIDNNYKFINNIDCIEFNKYKDKILIEKDNYDGLNLYNLENFITKTLEMYEILTNDLNTLKSSVEQKKQEFIENDNLRQDEIDNCVSKINSLYSNVSNLNINTSDYGRIMAVFENDTIIDSIVRVEREELINKLKNECVSNNFTELINDNDTSEKEVVNEVIKEENDKNVNNETKEINKKNIKIDFKKINEFINSLGLDFNTLKSLLDKLLCDEKICDILVIEGINISEVNLDNYSNLNEMIIDLYTKFDLDEESLKRIGKTLISKKSLLFSVLSSNKKVLFNVLKSDVIKKLLKK